MVFLFEFLFFAVALSVVTLSELFGRQPAVIGGVAFTLLSISGRLLVGRRVTVPAGRDRANFLAAPEKARWWQVTLDSWTHLNRALLAGSTVLLAWEAASRLLIP